MVRLNSKNKLNFPDHPVILDKSSKLYAKNLKNKNYILDAKLLGQESSTTIFISFQY